MTTSSSAWPRTRRGHWLLGSLIATIALVGAACSSDSNDDDDTGAATVADLEARGYADGHRLVTGAWLEEKLDNDSIVVLDLRNQEQYDAGHIPGARLVIPGAAFMREDEHGVTGQLGTADQIAAALGAAGVTPDQTIVLYDGNNSLWASRALWSLDVYGHAETRILDGAWAQWAASGRTVSTEPATFEASTYVFNAAPNSNIIANFDELVAAIDDPEALVCDARSAEEYAGRDVRSDQGGHIPGAANIDWLRAVSDNSEFRTASELRDLYEGQVLTGDTNQTIYVYCQTGVRAAHTWFVFHDLLGLDNVKNYDGSWQEWGNRSDSPIERS